MISVELTPDVVALLREMRDRGEQPPRCHDGVIRAAIAGAVRRLVEGGLSGGVRPWDLPALERGAASLGEVSAVTAVWVDANALVAELVPGGERILLRGVDDGWRLVRFADGDDVSVRPETTRIVALNGSGPDAALAALGVVKPDGIELEYSLDPRRRDQERDLRRCHTVFHVSSRCDHRRRRRCPVVRPRGQCRRDRGVSAMADIELIGVPFDGYGRAGNQTRAARVLRDAGLADAFDHHHVVDHNLELPEPDPARGASTSLINEPALLAMTDALNIRVGEAVVAGRFPVVYGGDCSSLFGIVTGLRDHVGDVGLVFIDGHEDTMPLDVSEDGEAANTEIGLLLGLTGRLLGGGLGDRLPALAPEQLTVLGPRDDAWRQRFNVGTLADSGVWVAPLAEVADDPMAAGRAAIAELAGHVDRWWLHIDLDVLDPVVFPSQGLPDVEDEPGGLTWDQLTDLVVSLFGSPAHCVGASLAIYDPDQDDDHADAAKIVEFVRNALARTTISP